MSHFAISGFEPAPVNMKAVKAELNRPKLIEGTRFKHGSTFDGIRYANIFANEMFFYGDDESRKRRQCEAHPYQSGHFYSYYWVGAMHQNLELVFDLVISPKIYSVSVTNAYNGIYKNFGTLMFDVLIGKGEESSTATWLNSASGSLPEIDSLTPVTCYVKHPVTVRIDQSGRFVKVATTSYEPIGPAIGNVFIDYAKNVGAKAKKYPKIIKIVPSRQLFPFEMLTRPEVIFEDACDDSRNVDGDIFPLQSMVFTASEAVIDIDFGTEMKIDAVVIKNGEETRE